MGLFICRTLRKGFVFGGDMNYLLKKLKEFGDINVSIVGAGLMGKSIFAQLIKMENFICK